MAYIAVLFLLLCPIHLVQPSPINVQDFIGPNIDKNTMISMSIKHRYNVYDPYDIEIAGIKGESQQPGCSIDEYKRSKRQTLRLYLWPLLVPRDIFSNSFSCDVCMTAERNLNIYFRIIGRCDDCGRDEMKTAGNLRMETGNSTTPRLNMRFTPCPKGWLINEIKFAMADNLVIRIFMTGPKYPIMKLQIKKEFSRLWQVTVRSRDGYFYLHGRNLFGRRWSGNSQGERILIFTEDILQSTKTSVAIFEMNTWVSLEEFDVSDGDIESVTELDHTEHDYPTSPISPTDSTATDTTTNSEHDYSTSQTSPTDHTEDVSTDSSTTTDTATNSGDDYSTSQTSPTDHTEDVSTDSSTTTDTATNSGDDYSTSQTSPTEHTDHNLVADSNERLPLEWFGGNIEHTIRPNRLHFLTSTGTDRPLEQTRPTTSKLTVTANDTLAPSSPSRNPEYPDFWGLIIPLMIPDQTESPGFDDKFVANSMQTTSASDSIDANLIPGATVTPKSGFVTVLDPLTDANASNQSNEPEGITVTDPNFDPNESDELGDIFIAEPIRSTAIPTESAHTDVTDAIPETNGSDDAVVTIPTPRMTTSTKPDSLRITDSIQHTTKPAESDGVVVINPIHGTTDRPEDVTDTMQNTTKQIETDKIDVTDSTQDITEQIKPDVTDSTQNITEPIKPDVTDSSHNMTEPIHLGVTESSHNITEPINLGVTESSHNITEPIKPDVTDSTQNITEPINLGVTGSTQNMTEPIHLGVTDSTQNITEPINLGVTESSHNITEPINLGVTESIHNITEPIKPDVTDSTQNITEPINLGVTESTQNMTEPINLGVTESSHNMTEPIKQDINNVTDAIQNPTEATTPGNVSITNPTHDSTKPVESDNIDVTDMIHNATEPTEPVDDIDVTESTEPGDDIDVTESTPDVTEPTELGDDIDVTESTHGVTKPTEPGDDIDVTESTHGVTKPTEPGYDIDVTESTHNVTEPTEPGDIDITHPIPDTTESSTPNSSQDDSTTSSSQTVGTSTSASTNEPSTESSTTTSSPSSTFSSSPMWWWSSSTDDYGWNGGGGGGGGDFPFNIWGNWLRPRPSFGETSTGSPGSGELDGMETLKLPNRNPQQGAFRLPPEGDGEGHFGDEQNIFDMPIRRTLPLARDFDSFETNETNTSMGDDDAILNDLPVAENPDLVSKTNDPGEAANIDWADDVSKAKGNPIDGKSDGHKPEINSAEVEDGTRNEKEAANKTNNGINTVGEDKNVLDPNNNNRGKNSNLKKNKDKTDGDKPNDEERLLIDEGAISNKGVDFDEIEKIIKEKDTNMDSDVVTNSSKIQFGVVQRSSFASAAVTVWHPHVVLVNVLVIVSLGVAAGTVA